MRTLTALRTGAEPRVVQGAALLAVAAALTTVVLWASAFAGIRAALPAYGPWHLAVLRFGVASLVLAGVATLRGLPRVPWGDAPRVLACAALGITTYNLALNYGELTVSAGAASFLVNTAPVFTALLAVPTLGERLPRGAWLGSLVALGGVGLIAAGEGAGLRWSPGVPWVLLAAVAQAGNFVLQKPLLARHSPLTVVALLIWAGTALMLPLAGGLAETVHAAPAAATWSVVYLGVFPGALAYLVWAVALRRWSAGRTAGFLYLVPAVALLVAWLWLSELPGPLSVAGGAVVLAGVFLLNRARG